MDLDSRRSRLNDHVLAELVVGDAVGDDENAIRRDLLGPCGRDLTMEKTGVDTDVRILDVAIAENGALGNGANGCCGSCGSCGCGGVGGLKLFGLHLHASACLGVDLLHNSPRRVGAHAGAVGGDEHGKAEAGDGYPVVMPLFADEAGDLVEGSTSPQVDQEQGVLLIIEGGDRVKQLLVHVVGTHVRRQNDGRNVFLRSEDHAARFHDALGEFTVASKDNIDHPTSSFASFCFLQNRGVMNVVHAVCAVPSSLLHRF